MDFNLYCKRLLSERPYYFSDMSSSGFDLELEFYSKDLEGLRNKIHDIISGKKVSDKRGITIELTNESEVNDFIDFLNNDLEIAVFMKHKFGKLVSYLYK